MTDETPTPTPAGIPRARVLYFVQRRLRDLEPMSFEDMAKAGFSYSARSSQAAADERNATEREALRAALQCLTQHYPMSGYIEPKILPARLRMDVEPSRPMMSASADIGGDGKPYFAHPADELPGGYGPNHR